jgi:hypothetical protein
MLQYVPGVPNSFQITQNVSKRSVVQVPVLDIESKHKAKILTVDSMPVPIDFAVGRYYDDRQLIVDPTKWSTLLPPVDDETAFAAVAPTGTFEDVFQKSKRARTSF